MSRQSSTSRSFLYGRPVTEWSTPPLDRETAMLGDEIGKMKLDSKEPYQSTAVPQRSTALHIKPLTLSQASHLPSQSTKFQPTNMISGTSSHSTKLPLPEYDYSADSRSLGPQAVRNTTCTSRQRHKVSSSSTIPTALVTPLPGTSPPHYSHEGRTCYDHQSVNMNREEVDGEDETRLKGVGWKLVEVVEDESHVPLIPGDNTVELIEKWKALIDTKDRIMKQKNAQIERQKVTISKLQQDVHESEAKLHHLMVAQVHEHGGSALEARLQALEAENASIRAKLTEALSSRNLELHTLSSKLNHKEYELCQAVRGREQSSNEAQQQVASLQDEVCKQQEMIRELQQKLAGAEAANKHHVEHIDRLNDYMGHMPSMEEHQALEMQGRELRVQFEKLSKDLSEKDTALKNALDEIKSKDLLAQSLEGVKKELEDTRLKLESHKQSLAVMEPETGKLKQECTHLQKVVVEAERRCRQELQAMRERHRVRFMEATAKLRGQYKSLAKRARALETQLTKNSDAMMALNTELQFSQGTIGALKSSIKDLVSQNQGLLERNLSLQESTTEALKVSSSLTEAQSSAAQQLGIELNRCVEEFESLVSLSMSLLEGQEPTAAMLFGSESQTLSPDMELSVDSGLESRLDQIKRLRKKIEGLRSTISEHFAAQLSSACNVQ